MLNKTPSPMRRVAASLKVVALATLLGTVVFAAERHFAGRVSPDEAVTAATAPAQFGAPASPAARDKEDFHYFPSQFPEPTGEPEEQPAAF